MVPPQVLGALRDIRCTTLTGEDAGSFKLTFVFDDNDFFKNKVGGACGWFFLVRATLALVGGTCVLFLFWKQGPVGQVGVCMR